MLGWKTTSKLQNYGLNLGIWGEGRETESNDKFLADCFEEYTGIITQSLGVQFDLRKLLFIAFLDLSLWLISFNILDIH